MSDNIETGELNRSVLASLDEQHAAQIHGLNAMIQTLLVTRPTSAKRLGRIDAGLHLLQAITGFHTLFAVVMNPKRSGTDVEDNADILEAMMDEVNEKLNKYVELQRGDKTDLPFDEARVMGTVWRERQEAEAANAELDRIAQKIAQAETEQDGKVSEVHRSPERVTLRVHREHPYEMPSPLTSSSKLVS